MVNHQQLLQQALGGMLGPQSVEQSRGPVMRNPTPDWLKPENDSVLDSLPEKAVKSFLRLLGADDPSEAVMGMTAPIDVPGLTSPIQKAMGAVKRVAKPIRAFHGTTDRALKIPDPRKAVEVSGASFFTDNRDVADQYQWPREYGEIVDGPRGRVIEANLHIENPMEVDFAGEVGEATRLSRLVREAKEKGHDALVVRNVDDTVDSSRQLGTSFAVFDKATIEFVKKYGIAAALGTGLLNESNRHQAALQQAIGRK